MKKGMGAVGGMNISRTSATSSGLGKGLDRCRNKNSVIILIRIIETAIYQMLPLYWVVC